MAEQKEMVCQICGKPTKEYLRKRVPMPPFLWVCCSACYNQKAPNIVEQAKRMKEQGIDRFKAIEEITKNVLGQKNG